ncbi:MAG: F0F1 ATP synthase subunit delta [Candidatus Daviesbacteria bacterium]
MIQQLINYILRDCFTKQEALKRLLELREALSKQLFASAKVNIQYDPAFPPLTTDNFDKVFDETENEIKKIPELTIFTALELPKEEILKLGSYLRQNFTSHQLMELKVDPDLIGGATLAWQGTLRDYSLRSKLKSLRTKNQ